MGVAMARPITAAAVPQPLEVTLMKDRRREIGEQTPHDDRRLYHPNAPERLTPAMMGVSTMTVPGSRSLSPKSTCPSTSSSTRCRRVRSLVSQARGYVSNRDRVRLHLGTDETRVRLGLVARSLGGEKRRAGLDPIEDQEPYAERERPHDAGEREKDLHANRHA
jgi:hypothetical protein